MNEVELSNIEINKLESLKLLDKEQQPLAYRMLSTNTKYYFWNNKLSNILKTQRLIQSQKTFIERVLSNLDVDFFSNNLSRQEKIFYKEQAENTKFEAETLFSKIELKYYFSSTLDINNDFPINNKLPSNGGPIDDGGSSGLSEYCNCNVADDYCIWGSSCFFLVM